jgi:VanZ family protein
LLWAVAIFLSSSIPSDQLPNLAILGFDKVVHLSIYCILAFLIHRALRRQTHLEVLQKNALSATIVLTIIYGISDEMHQMVVPGRNATVYDVLADGIGASSYAALFALWQRRSRSHHSRGF